MMRRFILSAAVVVLVLSYLGRPACADIFQWEYVDPSDPSKGIQQSTTLCIEGAGLVPVPYGLLGQHNLSRAYLEGVDLTGALLNSGTFTNASFRGANLSNVYCESSDFSNALLDGANLTNIDLRSTTLTGTSFSGATITGARLDNATARGLTKEQFYVTASYALADLKGVQLVGNDLRGWDLAGQNLTGASFRLAKVAGVNFTGALIADANFWHTTAQGFTREQLYSTTSYVSGDLGAIILGGNDLTEWDLAGKSLSHASFGAATLTNASFDGANLTDAGFQNATLTNVSLRAANLTSVYFDSAILLGTDFHDAMIQNASLYNVTAKGFTKEQLYATSNYKCGDLSGVRLGANDLTGWDFSGKKLADASFVSSTLTNASFEGADLTGAALYASTITNASFAGADLTGVALHSSTLTNTSFSGANLTRVSFASSTLGGSNFTDAIVKGVNLQSTTARGFTKEQLYSTSSYDSGDLSEITWDYNDLTGWNFAGKNLTNTRFISTTLTNADFTNATIAGANLNGATAKGFSKAQFYSTASYASGNLSSLNLGSNDLSGWNFAGKNLTNTNLSASTLSGADFTEARLQGANLGATTDKGFTKEQFYSTASYASGDLAGMWLNENDLTGWDFAGKNLTAVNLFDSTLSGVSFSGATITQANFGATTQKGFTKEQLYSTRSYAEGDLVGIGLFGNDLTGWSFAGKNLTGADLTHATLTYADFTGATIAGAQLTDTVANGFTKEQLYSTASYIAGDLQGIVLSGNDLRDWNFAGKSLAGALLDHVTFRNTDLCGADLRAAYPIHFPMDTSLAITTNAIDPIGTIFGLQLDAANPLLVVRDYDGTWPLPIRIRQQMVMDSGSVLQMLFADSTWGSTISFDLNVPVNLGGKLELGLAAGVDPADLAGTTFKLFDWTGVSPAGEFQILSDLPAGYGWDSSQLYTTGNVTLQSVPEPATFGLLTMAALAGVVWHRRRSR